MASIETKTKSLLILVSFFGAAALGFGGYIITQNIWSPFQSQRISSEQLLALVPKTPDQEAAEQRKKDTDGDGLNDYDEINLYATSPYLTDTDSDGLSDANEVGSGSDPNCAKGQDCRSIKLVTPDTKISDLFPQFSGSDITLKDKTLKEFRQVLLDQGYAADKLATIDDQTLLVILEESLKLQEQESATTTPGGSEPVDLDQIRLLLIELGVPEEEVYSLSNQEIEDILKTFK